MKEFVIIDSRRKVRHRATIGTVNEYVETGWLPESLKHYLGCGVRDMFSKDVKIFSSEEGAVRYLKKIYC